MSFLKNITKAVESKIVGQKVASYLDKLDETKLNNIADNYGELITDATKFTASILTQVITSSKPAIVKLAENNSSQLIKLNRIFDELGEIIESLDTKDNKKVLQTIGSDMKTLIANYDFSTIEKTHDAIESDINDMIKPFMPTDKPGKFYVYNATDEHIEVSKDEFYATKKHRMSVSGAFHYYEQGNDKYESVATKE